MNIIENLEKRKLIHPPKWLPNSVNYVVTGGSVAYGVNKESSDNDIIGFCIPPKEHLFYIDEIYGFGDKKNRFEQYIEHGIIDKDKNCNYDITCYSISKFFNLAKDCNPNIIELLYVPQDCILFSTQVGNLIRENRKLFLHKGAWHKHKGYAYSSLHKCQNRSLRLKFVEATKTTYKVDFTYKELCDEEYNRTNKNSYIKSKLKEVPIGTIITCRQILDSTRNNQILDENQGFDRKFACHTVRLLLQVEQILLDYDLDLRKHSEHLKAIRRGDISEDEIKNWFTIKEKELEKVYHSSTIPHSPDIPKIKNLLIQCLEIHYESIDKYVEKIDIYKNAIQDIKKILDTL